MADDERPLWMQVARPLPEPRSFVGGVVAPGEADAYAQAAFKAEVAQVAAAQPGIRNHTLNVAAFNLSQLVASGHLRHEDAWNGLYDAALSTGLTEREVTATLSSGFRAGTRSPRDVPERPQDGPRAPQSGPEESPGGFPRTGDGTEGEAEALIAYPEPLDWLDLWEQDDEEEEWIVKPIIPARRLIALYSKAKVGKSLLMLEVAVGVSRGCTVLGYTPERPRRVLYVDLENDPRGDIRSRLQQMGHKPTDLDNLLYLSFPDMPMLDTAMGAAYLLALVEHYGCEVVIIDTISRLVAGEENDNNTWLSFYRHTGKQLKAHGVTCIRLDHTGKDLTKGMRGGSAKYSDVDLVWWLKPAGDGLALECMAQRLPVTERFVKLTRRVDPWLHHDVADAPRQAAWKADRDDNIAFLDRLVGEDVPLSVRKAAAHLRNNGRRIRNDDLAALIRARNDALNDRGLTYETDPEEDY